MIKNTPAMGWNTWNTFGAEINEQLVLETVDKFVEKGFKEYGYEYIIIDDCWSLKERDKNGKLVADPKKFPHGMKYVADYIHSKGLKFGMYSCSGHMTCAGYPSSYGHEFVDAATFAEWGVDYLKYDFCNYPHIKEAKYSYRTMGLALANCGRDIHYAACSWGQDQTPEWIRSTGASSWRSTTDIFDNFDSIKFLINAQTDILPYGGKGCVNDMDMLIVGMNNKGNVALGGCNEEEYKLHFAAWCLFGSPLILGCDIRDIDEKSMAILTNKDLIEIDQDPQCSQVVKLISYYGGTYLARLLSNGDLVLGFFNMDDEGHNMSCPLEALAITPESGKSLKLRELYDGSTLEPFNDCIFTYVEKHSCKIWRCKIVDKE